MSIVIVLIPSLVFYFFFANHYSKTFKVKFAIYPLAQSIFSVGLLTFALFLFLNKHFAESASISKELKIEKIGSYSGRSKQTWAMVNYKGTMEQFEFKRGTQMELSNRIELEISKGFFGFDIIRKIKIKN
jgi:hypothetical protein